MPAKLTANAVERSTYAITISFYDEAGAPVTPNAGLTWTLTDSAGNVINGRSSVNIAPAPSVTIVLSGNDLALSAYDDGRRIIHVSGTYNSTLGSNLPLRDEAAFRIINLAAIS